MEHTTRIQLLFQACFSILVLSYAFILLIWAWTLISQSMEPAVKRPSLNLKEL